MKIKILMGLCFLSLIFATNVRASVPVSLSKYASQIAGKPVTVRCQKLPKGMYGYTFQNTTLHDDGTETIGFDPDIFLSPSTCFNLRRLRSGRIVSYYYSSNALETLIHEAFHIRLNSGNESRVECTAMKNLWNYILAYGFSAADNKRLYSEAWEAHWNLGGDYEGGGCPKAPVTVHPIKPKNIPAVDAGWIGY